MSDDWTDEWDGPLDPADPDADPGWPKGPDRRRRVLTVVGVVAALVLATILFGVNWVQARIDPAGPPGEEITVEIPNGTTTKGIGEILEGEGVITSAQVWGYWTRLEGVGPFQAGLYVFRLDSSFDEAVEVLEGGPLPPEAERVTIPEGLTVAEIAVRLADPELGLARWDAEVFRALLTGGEIRSRFQPADQPSLEGFLFPDTYEVAEGTDEAAFLRQLVEETDRRLLALDVEAAASRVGLTPYEVLVAASLVEEEAKLAEERPKIARVILNRLERGIPLGIDATSRYEAELAGRSRDDIDFDSDSPYNTRRVAGLPPTPIAAAGVSAVQAVLAPADGDWIYYVASDAAGHHFFTASYDEFLAAKQRCADAGLGCG